MSLTAHSQKITLAHQKAGLFVTPFVADKQYGQMARLYLRAPGWTAARHFLKEGIEKMLSHQEDTINTICDDAGGCDFLKDALRDLKDAQSDLENLRTKITSFAEQAKLCGYECEGGPLENNQTFVELVMAARLFERKRAMTATQVDPRDGLRPCEIMDCGPAYFHQFFIDADGEATAIIEYPDGHVQVVYAWHVRFTDVPEVKE